MSACTRRWMMLLGAAGLVALATPASARRGRVRLRVGGLAGRGPYGPGIMTQDELERCLRLESSVNRGAEVLDGLDDQLSAREAEIERLGREIDLSAARLNRYSQGAVAAHNNMVAQHQTLVRSFNASLPGRNAQAEAYNGAIRDFNEQCAGKRYYDADMQAARARLGLN